jgi:hypothetical protein
MSEENVEVVRELYEAMDAGRLDPVLSFLDPEIEYVNPPDAIDPGTRHGIQGMVEAVANVTEPFESSAHKESTGSRCPASIASYSSRTISAFPSDIARAVSRDGGVAAWR